MPDKRRPHPELYRALAALFAESPKEWKPYTVETAIARNPEGYGALTSLSSTAIHHAAKGNPITNRTAEILTSFIRVVRPSLLPPKLEEVDLDLGRFFCASSNKMTKSGLEIEGHYQTYARSTTSPKYLRLGRISFSFRNEVNRQRILIEEEQYRPARHGLPEAHIQWEGFAAARGSKTFFAVLRAQGTFEDDIGMMYVFERLRKSPRGPIITLRGNATHFEPETNCYVWVPVFLSRTPKEQIKLDFIPLARFKDEAVLNAIGANKPR